MNRRGFLKFLGMAAAGSTVAYSFPSIIVPKNIGQIEIVNDLAAINIVTKNELWPSMINDFWFTESSLFARLRENVNV